jgi:hypothetical protein
MYLLLQWAGALFIIAGHILNASGTDGYNIAAFSIGTLAFLAWSIHAGNQPQTLLNTVSMIIHGLGLWRAFVA